MVEREVIDSTTCDKCGLAACHSGEGVLDAQEFMHWRRIGGYGSVFGDGSVLELDLCQGCVQELLGEYIRVVDSVW